MSTTPTTAQANLVTAVNGCLVAGLDPRLAVTTALSIQGATGGAFHGGQQAGPAQVAMTAAVEAIIANGMDVEVAFVKAQATIGGSEDGWASLTPGQQGLVDAPEVV